MNGKKILIIDDDEELTQVLGFIYKRAGAQVASAPNGEDGLRQVLAFRPHLVILDVKMPGMDGFEVCRRIRKISGAAIVMLSALSEDMNMLEGLDAGADDFISKPFNPELLLARSRTVLRRSAPASGRSSSYRTPDGQLELDADSRRVRLDGRTIKLTEIEFRLLSYLLRNTGRVLTFDQILANVWGSEYSGSVEHVHIFISHLRKKLGDERKNPRFIRTVHGVGYSFGPEG